MKKISALLLCAGFLALTSCSTLKQHATVELFNGKDLDGWRYALAKPEVTMDQVWSVQDGILTCKGDPIGVLYKGPAATNFKLVVEYRWPGEPGNSGIFSRINLPPQALPRAIEAQLKHGSAGDVLGLQGKPVAAGQPRFFEVKKHAVAGDISGVKKLLDAENPAGQWNKVEILAQGPHYKVWVNGKLVNDVQGVDVNAGPVGVQSEGGVVQFRRVALTSLD